MSETLYEKVQNDNFREIDLSSFTQNNHLVVFSWLPELQYWCQTIRFPGISMSLVQTHMPKGPEIHFDAGTTYTFEPLRITFLADEKLEGWTSLFDWITRNTTTWDFASHTVDATILLLSNAKKPYMRVEFQNLIPESLDGFDLDSRQSEVVTYTATFRYSSFQFHPYTTPSLQV